MTKRVFVKQSALDDMLAHARAAAPLECCGLLVGREDRVERTAWTRNARASETRYLVDPVDHFAAIRLARQEGLHVVGAYHSHPRSAAVPSATDLAEAAYPELVYVIVALEDKAGPTAAPDLRAYRLAGDRFDEVEIVAVA